MAFIDDDYEFIAAVYVKMESSILDKRNLILISFQRNI